MTGAELLTRVRRAVGVSQHEMARRAGTSRTAVSAYEHGAKSPSLDTVTRLLHGVGYDVDARPRIDFAEISGGHRRRALVPSSLPRLPLEQALGSVTLPLAVNWSQPGRVFRLSDRSERARIYELVLSEGGPADILAVIDGALLVDLWPELVLPRDVRAAWAPLVERVVVPAAPDVSVSA